MMSGEDFKLAGVMGWPVAHSLSPRLHGHWLKRYGIDGAYVPLAVRPGDLEKCLRSLGPMGFRGVNITVPHKQMALEICDQTDEEAGRIGAVNTISVGDDGRLVGSNTDGFGFLENIKSQNPAWRADRGPAVVLGAGGAARGVCTALMGAGAPEIKLVNRTLARAQALAGDLGGTISAHSWEERGDCLEGAALLVNTTSLGMQGEAELDLDLAGLPSEALVTDIVYAPLETSLLAGAKMRGHPAIDGLGMLLHQARPGFAAWFGAEPQVDGELRRVVLEGR
ncbi:MAG: shikimate dehydrogenase [Rhodospirillales bacterium]|nr:shikimate dehydrogenase [Rhodospirillales bacterium]